MTLGRQADPSLLNPRGKSHLPTWTWMGMEKAPRRAVARTCGRSPLFPWARSLGTWAELLLGLGTPQGKSRYHVLEPEGLHGLNPLGIVGGYVPSFLSYTLVAPPTWLQVPWKFFKNTWSLLLHLSLVFC